MLVLTRRTDELILIGDDVTVQVLKVKGRQVKLGIVAPNEVRVTRAKSTENEKPRKTGRPDAKHLAKEAD